MSNTTVEEDEAPIETLVRANGGLNKGLTERSTAADSASRDSLSVVTSPSYLWLMILAAVTLFAVGIYFLYRRASVDSTGPTANLDTSSVTTLAPEQLNAVAVEVVQKHSLETEITVPGKITFNGNRVTPVFSQFSGRIIKLDAEVGSTIRAGQVIAAIDTPDIVGIQSDYLQSLAAQRSARTTLELAKRTRERSGRLATAEAIPQRDLQQAQADEAHAGDDLKRAESSVAAARGRLQSAGMSEAEINLVASGARPVGRIVRVVAPIAATVIERKAGIGQVVQPGSGEPLFMLADLSAVWINADVYEDQLAHIHTGASMKVTTPAYPNESFAARIDQIGPTLDPDKHTVAVRCVVVNEEGRLKPGMFASVILGAATQQDVIIAPTSAVITEGNQRSIFVEEAPGKYEKRTIDTGGEVDGATVIRAGLKEGERVVVHGSLLLANSTGQQ